MQHGISLPQRCFIRESKVVTVSGESNRGAIGVGARLPHLSRSYTRERPGNTLPVSGAGEPILYDSPRLNRILYLELTPMRRLGMSHPIAGETCLRPATPHASSTPVGFRSGLDGVSPHRPSGFAAAALMHSQFN